MNLNYIEAYFGLSEVEWYQPCVFDINVVDSIIFFILYYNKMIKSYGFGTMCLLGCDKMWDKIR